MIKTHASLFSGIGGFDLAAERMGWRNAFHCEINEFCTKILNYHFPDAEHYKDITKTDFSKWRGCINVLSGGFPCQPFSVAGQRKGADDDRYLWPEMLRAVREIQPSWVVGENVAGILTMVQPGETVEVGRTDDIFGEGHTDEETRRQSVVETVCRDLEREGYSVQPFLIPACAVGAPHRRDRVWFVARRSDTGAEALQSGGEDGVCSAGTATDTDINGCRNGENKQVQIKGGKGTPVYSNGGTDWTSANATSEQSERHKFGQPQNGTKEQGEFERGGGENHAGQADTHPDGERPACRNGKTPEGRSVQGKRPETLRGAPSWADFPTQSPVCGGDDGLPFDVDGLSVSFSKWRQESIRAYGNAVVPQVVYEIFKAIQETCE